MSAFVDSKDMMLVINALDPGASLAFSHHTGMWYVDSRISIGDGTLLNGGSEHRATPEEAVEAFFERLTTLDLDHYVVSKYCGHRREWTWNGAAFAECTRPEALPKPLEPSR